jgi:hypothetical protein
MSHRERGFQLSSLYMVKAENQNDLLALGGGEQLISHQSTSVREALVFQGLRKTVVRKNLLWDLFGWVGMPERSDDVWTRRPRFTPGSDALGTVADWLQLGNTTDESVELVDAF